MSADTRAGAKTPPQVDHETIMRSMRQIGDTLGEFSRTTRAAGLFGHAFSGRIDELRRLLDALPDDELRRIAAAGHRIEQMANVTRGNRLGKQAPR